MRILVIGKGEIGEALGECLKPTNAIFYWDRNPEKRSPEGELADLARGADAIFFCVPSTGLRETAEGVVPAIGKETILVSLPKGMEAGTKKTPLQALRGIFPTNPIVILGGPMLSDEIRGGRSALAVLGGKDAKANSIITDMLATGGIYAESTPDEVGLSLAGILKNIYSLAFGFAEGLGFAANIEGLLASDAIREMQETVELMGGRKETVLGPGGLGDLIASGMSSRGYNRRAGMEMVTRGRTDLVSEGAISIGPISSLLGEKAKSFGLLCLIQKILFSPGSAKALFLDYLKTRK